MPAEHGYVVRPALMASRAEQTFIIRTWLDLYRLNYTSRSIPNEVYFWHHHKLVESLRDRPQAKWIVCAHPDDASVIFAFGCGELTPEAPVLHFAFVKSRFRRWGLATRIVDELAQGYDRPPALVVTHMTPDFRRFRHQLPVIFNPYLAYNPERKENHADRGSDLHAERGLSSALHTTDPAG